MFYWKPVKEATIQYLLFFEGMNSLLMSGYKIMACDLVMMYWNEAVNGHYRQ